ncbi:MAG TPA: alpha-amylase family glycosyl hydrolase, partial [Blastocatellia bacterium]|nr:alpha-amylase family glycosyl hydrolase [Blastocatellia bacterium]
KIMSRDLEGSPYAVPEYTINPDLGGQSAFLALVDRAHNAGLSVILDFVSNHLALDSPLISENPAFFILSDPGVRKQTIDNFFLHSTGNVVAYGKDPYFAPWLDTAQLDYTNRELRRRMISTLKWIATIADGVRCDMAMLVLKDQIRRQWYPLVTDEWFNLRMPNEFWAEAWSEVKQSNPGFLAIAEVYWDKEAYLMELGFDLCYEKKLYDGLVHRQPELIRNRLTMPTESLRRSLFFIENHDEQRAATIFNRDENLAAAAMILALPGSAMIHEGQMEGFRQHIPVQVVRLKERESADSYLRQAYQRLTSITSARVFREGAYEWFDTGNESVVAFLRRDADRMVAFFGQVGERSERFADTVLDASALFAAAGFPPILGLANLINRDATANLTSRVFSPRTLLPGFCETDRFLLVEATWS